MVKAIEGITDKNVTFADIRQEIRMGTRMLVVNSDLRSFNRTNKTGAVARVLIGECWGQASTTQPISKETLSDLLQNALKMAKSSAKYSRKKIDLSEISSVQKSVWQKVKKDPADVTDEEKLELAMELDKGQKIDERVVNSNCVYQDAKRVYRLVNTLGSNLEWDELRVYAVVQTVAKEGETIQADYDVQSGRAGYEIVKDIDPNEFAGNCARGAIDLLSAARPPSGKMTVILDGDNAGLIAHEVCGHGSEADEVVKGRSFLTGLVGEKVGTDLVTMVDDGSLDGPSGGFPFDSEGTPSSRTLIIENGVFKGYMHTLETAVLMGVNPTGNGRAQDYNRRIFARMTNTFFEKGDWKDEEIISDTKDGIYVLKAHSGMEDVVGGGVQCSALKGYIIKNGEKTQLVRRLALAGKVLEILNTVDAVGNKLQFSGGNCGKGEEDFIPVSSGGPHMRAQLIVGGG